MSNNIWAVVGTVTGYIPVTALTGNAGEIFAMNEAGTAATWKPLKILNDRLLLRPGTVGAPELVFEGSLTTGWYQPAADQWNYSQSTTFVLGLSVFGFFWQTLPFKLHQTAIQLDKSPDISAAATTDLANCSGNTVDITHTSGILAITSLGAATSMQAGTTIETKFVITGGTLSLTHNATSLVLLGGSNITLQNGDIARWRKISDASAWWEMVSFQRGVSTSALQNKGDWLLGAGGGATVVLPVGTNNQIPVADSAQTSGIRWTDSPIQVVGQPRQTVLLGTVNSLGAAEFVGTGSGLTYSISVLNNPILISFAGGYSITGVVDKAALISSTQSNQGSLVANNINYLHSTWVSNSSVTWSQCLVPPEYSNTFSKTRGALLNFEGADGSTTFIDSFGNTWAPTGNAQIDTAQAKFGSSSLLLDGTGDYIESTNFTSVGGDSWEASIWFRASATSGLHVLFAAENASGFGAVLILDHNAGARRLRVELSGNGTSDNIGETNGSTTTIALDTWYKARLTYDTLQGLGTYRVFLSNNGAAESQELQITPAAARICAISHLRIGDGLQAGHIEFNGWLDAFRYVQCATSTGTETPSASAPAITDFPYHWFSIPEMKMYEVTGPSLSAGNNPTMTAKDRVFVGEADTSGAAVTAVRTYALRGEAVGFTEATTVSGTPFVVNHNLGVVPRESSLWLINKILDKAYVPGDRIMIPNQYDAATGAVTISNYRNIGQVNIGTGVGGMDKSGTTGSAFTLANWNRELVFKRGW